MGRIASKLGILLILCVTIINGQYFFSLAKQENSVATPTLLPIKGRLLTPEEGCGLSKVSQKRIVGGGPAKNGKPRRKRNEYFEMILIQ